MRVPDYSSSLFLSQYCFGCWGSFVLASTAPQPTLGSRPFNTSRWVLRGPFMTSMLFLLWPGAHKILRVPSKSGVSISPSPVEFCGHTPPAFKARFTGSPLSVSRPPGWGAWCGAQNAHSCGKTSEVQLYSLLWVTHPEGMGFDYVGKPPLLSSCCGFFVFGCWISFLVVFFFFVSSC